MGITTELAENLFSIKSLSNDDIEQLHTLIIDFFAAAYAGYKLNREFNQSVEKIILNQGGVEESHILFQKKKYPARLAAFMNSVYGHGAELDDGNKKAAGHAGVHLIPAVFALAEKLESTNDEVLVAIATGYEAYIRISSAAQPGLIQHGFHSTGMAGTLACAAACARLYHLDTQGIENAIALATTMSSGLLSYGDSRPAIKPLNPGKAAENGMFAAMMVAEGVKGPKEALEGQNGWFQAVTDAVNEDCLKGTNHLLLHECYFKLYPSCRHTHCGIDAAISLHGEFKIDEIEEIRVYIYPNAIKLAGIKYPQDQNEAKFSIPYTLSCALINGAYGIDDMNPIIMTDEIREVIDRIKLIPDESMENKAKGVRGTRVKVVLKNGEEFERVILVPKGDPENPLTREDIIEKLRLCTKWDEKDKFRVIVDKIKNIKGSRVFMNPAVIVGG